MKRSRHACPVRIASAHKASGPCRRAFSQIKTCARKLPPARLAEDACTVRGECLHGPRRMLARSAEDACTVRGGCLHGPRRPYIPVRGRRNEAARFLKRPAGWLCLRPCRMAHLAEADGPEPRAGAVRSGRKNAAFLRAEASTCQGSPPGDWSLVGTCGRNVSKKMFLRGKTQKKAVILQPDNYQLNTTYETGFTYRHLSD